MKEDILDIINEQFHDDRICIVPIDVNDLVIEERISLNCFYCGKYNNNWRCPPNLPDIDYKKVFQEYSCAALVYAKMPFTEKTYTDVRNESSVILHKALLKIEKILWNNNFPMAASFIGGSCKLCKNGCGKDKCNNPYMSRSPIEATGVNILKSAEKYGINISFPPSDYMLRIGLILW